MKVFPFTSRFVKTVSEVNEAEHRYLADESLKDRIVEFAPAFIWILINEYYDHNWDGQPPTEILEATSVYK